MAIRRVVDSTQGDYKMSDKKKTIGAKHLEVGSRVFWDVYDVGFVFLKDEGLYLLEQ